MTDHPSPCSAPCSTSHRKDCCTGATRTGSVQGRMAASLVHLLLRAWSFIQSCNTHTSNHEPGTLTIPYIRIQTDTHVVPLQLNRTHASPAPSSNQIILLTHTSNKVAEWLVLIEGVRLDNSLTLPTHFKCVRAP